MMIKRLLPVIDVRPLLDCICFLECYDSTNDPLPADLVRIGESVFVIGTGDKAAIHTTYRTWRKRGMTVECEVETNAAN
jgi:hypothetical protein